MKKNNIIIPSLRINETLAKRIEFLVKKEGYASKAEFIRRALAEYTSQFFEDRKKPQSARELLEIINKRTGKAPKMKKPPKELFDDGYREEGEL